MSQTVLYAGGLRLKISRMKGSRFLRGSFPFSRERQQRKGKKVTVARLPFKRRREKELEGRDERIVALINHTFNSEIGKSTDPRTRPKRENRRISSPSFLPSSFCRPGACRASKTWVPRFRFALPQTITRMINDRRASGLAVSSGRSLFRPRQRGK